MMRLLRLEIRRLITTKMTWILLLAGFILTALMAYLPLTFGSVTVTGEEGQKTVLNGREAVAYVRDVRSGIEGEVTPEKVRKALEVYQECMEEYQAEHEFKLPEDVYNEKLLPYSPYFKGIREAFSDPDTGMAADLRYVSPEEVENYYEKADERLASLMKMEQGDYPSAQEQAAEMYSEVTTPFYYVSGVGSDSMDYQVLTIYMITIFCVVIVSSVFSSDYQTGADDILRCTKHGRVRLAVTKIISALLILGAAFLLYMSVWIVLTNSLFGWESTKTSLQMMFSISSLPDVNIGELELLNAGVSFLLFLAIVSFALFVSTKMGKNVSALAVSLIFCFLPVICYMAVPGMTGTWLQCLLPAGGIGLGNSFLYAFIDLEFLHAGELSLWTPYAMAVAAVVQIPVFLGLAVYSHCKMRK